MADCSKPRPCKMPISVVRLMSGPLAGGAMSTRCSVADRNKAIDKRGHFRLKCVFLRFTSLFFCLISQVA